jgi:hypothetical protein
MKQKINIKRQAGIALWIIFAAIALMAAFGGVIYQAMRSSSTSTANDTQSTLASSILSQAAQMKQGFDHMVTNGITIGSMTFSNIAASATDLFGSGNAILPTAPDKAFPTATGVQAWVFYTPGSTTSGTTTVNGAKITGVGNSKNWLAILPNITQAACQAIDTAIAGTTAAIPTSATVDLSVVTNTTTTALDLTGFVTGTTKTDNRAAFCVQDKNSKYYLYSALLEQ